MYSNKIIKPVDNQDMMYVTFHWQNWSHYTLAENGRIIMQLLFEKDVIQPWSKSIITRNTGSMLFTKT